MTESSPLERNGWSSFVRLARTAPGDDVVDKYHPTPVTWSMLCCSMFHYRSEYDWRVYMRYERLVSMHVSARETWTARTRQTPNPHQLSVMGRILINYRQRDTRVGQSGDIVKSRGSLVRSYLCQQMGICNKSEFEALPIVLRIAAFLTIAMRVDFSHFPPERQLIIAIQSSYFRLGRSCHRQHQHAPATAPAASHRQFDPD
jgi:hypothetical protein